MWLIFLRNSLKVLVEHRRSIMIQKVFVSMEINWALMAHTKGHQFAIPVVLLMHSTQHGSYCLSVKFRLSLWNAVFQMFGSLRIVSAQQAGKPFGASTPSAGAGSLLVLSWLMVPNRSEAFPGGDRGIFGQTPFSFVFILLLVCSSTPRLTNGMRELRKSLE